MSFKCSASNKISGKTTSTEGKSANATLAASRCKEGESSVVSERKVVSPKSQQLKLTSTLQTVPKSPKPATKQTSQASDGAQTHRHTAPEKMLDRNSSNRSDKTLSSIVKVKNKKDNCLPVSWRKELYGTRPGSAQARLENLRAALQKEVEEQKITKAASSIPIKRSYDGKSPPKEVTLPTTSNQSSSVSVTTVKVTSAVPVVATVKHPDVVSEVPVVKHAGTTPTAVREKLENSFEMDVDSAETNSPKPEVSFPRAEQTASSSCGRYNAPAKIAQPSNRSLSSRLDKTLSGIVKVKHKKDNGLPVAWRKELYGTRPGSAQARLENLRAALQKEAEEQKISKPTSSLPIKRSDDRKSAPKDKVTSTTTTNQSGSASVTTVTEISAVPVVATVKYKDTEGSVVQQTSIAPVTTNRIEKHSDSSCEMDVDETNSSELANSFPSAVQTSSKGMELDSFAESKMRDANANDFTKFTEEVKHDATKSNTKEEANDDKVASDLKTKYKDGLSAFASYFYCVIDTNIFIEYYNDFQNFLSRKYAGSQPIVIIPYKVLHELDIVKHKKPQLAIKITPVVKFLHQMLRAKDARVKGQHPWDDTIELMPVLSPDDSIINCALQVQSVAASGNVNVVLVSNDCNMLTKALVANLNSCTMEELQADYKF